MPTKPQKLKPLSMMQAMDAMVRLQRPRFWPRVRIMLADFWQDHLKPFLAWLRPNPWKLIAPCPRCGAPVYGRRKESRRTCAVRCDFSLDAPVEQGLGRFRHEPYRHEPYAFSGDGYDLTDTGEETLDG